MNKQNLITIGRWIAVLPAAVAGLLVGSLVSNLFFSVQMFFTNIAPGSFWAEVNHSILSSIIAAAAAVYLGCRTAPTYRKIVSLILGALLVMLATVGVISALYIGEEVGWTIASAISIIFGTGIVIYTFFEEGEDYTFG